MSGISGDDQSAMKSAERKFRRVFPNEKEKKNLEKIVWVRKKSKVELFQCEPRSTNLERSSKVEKIEFRGRSENFVRKKRFFSFGNFLFLFDEPKFDLRWREKRICDQCARPRRTSSNKICFSNHFCRSKKEKRRENRNFSAEFRFRKIFSRRKTRVEVLSNSSTNKETPIRWNFVFDRFSVRQKSEIRRKPSEEKIATEFPLRTKKKRSRWCSSVRVGFRYGFSEWNFSFTDRQRFVMFQ